MNITNMKISELKEYENNPRLINDEAVDKVAASIKEFGFKVPIIVDEENVIVAGHTRKLAAQSIGMEEVPVIIADDLTEDQIKAFRLADNKVAEFSDWNMDLLMAGLDDVEMDMDDFGFDDFEEIPEDVEEDNFDEEPPVDPISKIGDVYQLGRHRVMCGSATVQTDIDKLTDGKVPDMVFTDPPYGMNYSGRGNNTSNTIMGDDTDPTEFYNVGAEIQERYIWGRVENYKHLKTEPRDTIIWRKNNFGMGRGYRGQYECCFYYGNFDGSDSDVWDVAKDTNYQHPTQKPVELAARAIKNSQPKVVIDYFGGSGSTLMACEQMNKTCYTMELDPKYVDVIINRWEEYTGKKAVLVNG